MDLQEILKNFENKAKEVFQDNDKLKNLLKSVKNEIESNKKLKGIIEELKMFIDMVKDYVNGDYKDISEKTILLIIVALLYLISPIDIIPDFLPGGFLDDLLVIYFVLKIIREEVELYRIWKSRVDNVVYNIKERNFENENNEDFEIIDLRNSDRKGNSDEI